MTTNQLIYTDRFDRVLATSARMLSGSYNRIDVEYDALGRIARESAPCWSASCIQYWTTRTYDLLGRVTLVQRPTSDSNSTLASTSLYYEGLQTRVVDAMGMVSTYTNNAAGLLVRSADHDSYYQIFDYDAFGNVVRVSDSGSNVLQSNTYNVKGVRTAITDMDMGAWVSTPNALGEIISQTDAKTQTTTFGYDLIGRMTSRSELEGTSTFTFGTSAASHNIGRLQSMSGPDYTEGFIYDGVGRLSQRTITSDATYQVDYTYNAMGAVDTLTYPTSTSSYRLKLQYEYQNGALKSVKDFNATATVFWTANDSDPRGSIINETLGNGIQTVRGFDLVTGALDSIQSGLGGGAARQDSGYEWDAVGNLTKLTEANLGLTLEYFYDSLYRLDYATQNGTVGVDLTYNQMGNITNRSGLGSYTYHSSRKHMVLSAGTKTFTYDNNGNAITRNGSTVTWYSYNLPKLVSASGSNSSEFFYGPDRARWKQNASYAGTSEQTIYIGGLIEKVTRSGVTSWRHYIAGGTGMVAEYIRRSSGTNETVYLLRGHSGSIEMLTDVSGNSIAQLAYGVQGARRNGTTWSGVPSSAESTAITNNTRRGYTSHEMLDNLDLVHMNGRVYDNTVGRFLSADPYIQAPGFTQSFNRYSYAWNNPLSYTDPSGFDTSHGLQFDCEYACASGGGGVESSVYSAGRYIFTFGSPAPATYDSNDGRVNWGGSSDGIGGSERSAQNDPPPTPVIVSDTYSPDNGVSTVDGYFDRLRGGAGMLWHDALNNPQQIGAFLSDAVVGFGDGAYHSITFGGGDLSNVRAALGIGEYNADVDVYNLSFTAGSIEGGAALGGAFGLVGRARSGWEFSHWVPDRFFRNALGLSRSRARFWGRHWGNGAFAPKWFHAITDASRFPGGWMSALPKFPFPIGFILRTPPALVGGGLGAIASLDEEP